MYKLELMYRDGENYKSFFDIEVTEEFFKDFVCGGDSSVDYDSELEHVIDHDFSGDPLFEIESFGLKPFDIPLIASFGFGDMDHNYVSITKVEEIK